MPVDHIHSTKAGGFAGRIALRRDVLADRARHWLRVTFPERQLYIRSQGRVQFFTLGTNLQAASAGLCLIFLGWVAFASVNVIFKDQIIATADRRYRQTQSAYRNRIADLEASYATLNAALVSSEDTFQSGVDEFNAKQRIFSKVLKRKTAVDRSLAALQNSRPPPPGTPRDELKRAENASDDSNAANDDYPEIELDTDDGDSHGPGSKAAKRFGALRGIIERLESFFHPRKSALARRDIENRPVFRALAKQIARIQRMNRAETALLETTNRQISQTIGHIDKVLHDVGMKPNVAEGTTDSQGLGGPFVPISKMRIAGIADRGFTKVLATTIADEKELETLFAVLRHVPLTTPVHGAPFEMTSGFGPRIDPFTHHVGFHPGMDFAGPWGSLIYATAPGKVVLAGWDGGFGKMVKIDHGFGIETGYGHMSSILVHPGMAVKRGTPIGRIGSTGRSTGPHVHYEIWLHDVPSDPEKFIAGGRDVDE